MNDDVTRAFPHAVGPEKSILSTMLQDPIEFIGVAIEMSMTPGHFYLPAHRVLFEELSSRFEKSEPIEFISMIQSLLDNGKLDSIGGPSYMTEIYTYAPSPSHFRYHVGIVKDKFTLRCVLNSCAEAAQAVYDEPDQVEALLDATEASIMGIREGRDTMKIESVKEAVQWVIDDFQDRLRGKCEIQGLKTGFSDLDRMTGGLKPGEMYVIAARPSMGKTSFMMNIVENVALDQQIPCMVFSCEMTRRQIVQRLVYSRSKFDASQLSRGYQPDRLALTHIRNTALAVAAAPLIVDDMPGITISQMRAKARRAKREKKIEMIAIDYLQLMRSTSRQATNSREREISEISAGIKGLAKELDLPIIILAQLNRGPESRSGKKDKVGVPRMSDLRESGAIEQDADMVGLLYRSAYYAESEEDKEAAAGESELIIAKNRNGETGHIPLSFIPSLMRFETGTFKPREEPKDEPKKQWNR